MLKLFKNKLLLFALIAIILVAADILNALPNGYTGVTRKTTTTGCFCHTNNTAITGAVTGPDTVITGTTTVYTITINRSGYTGAHGGVDIATRIGTLSVLDNRLKLVSGELTHQNPMNFVAGVVTVTFNYIAPGTPGIDTIWSNVAAGYTNGFNWSPEKRIVVRPPLGINNENTNANSFSLNQNYPNPFNPITTIRFSIPKAEYVKLVIFDITGKEINTVVSNILQAGKYDVVWNGLNDAGESVSSGYYFYKITAGDYTLTRKMTLLK